MAACQKEMKLVLNKKNEYALIRSQVVNVKDTVTQRG